MKFVCDEMLAGLGRWLRAAGYDTAIADGGRSDRALLDRAVAEDRLLVTRDRQLTEFRGAEGRVLLLDEGDLGSLASQLTRCVGVDWHHRPFSRCLVCNTPLEDAGDERRAEMPEGARGTDGPLRRCPDCDRLYWTGSHVRRMRRRLEELMPPRQ